MIDTSTGCVIEGQHNVLAFEVEDTHPIDEGKLRKYTRLWWLLDSTTTLDLAVVTVDRYGQEWTDVVIGEEALLLTVEDAAERAKSYRGKTS
jgi:hypothetical protein